MTEKPAMQSLGVYSEELEVLIEHSLFGIRDHLKYTEYHAICREKDTRIENLKNHTERFNELMQKYLAIQGNK